MENKLKPNMEQNVYAFNNSQDVVTLQTKYALFKRVINILFSVTFDDGFDEDLMHKAIDLMIARNDSLRLKEIKVGKESRLIFEPERKIGTIPSLSFATSSQFNAYLRRYRKAPTDLKRGRSLEARFYKDPAGKQSILFKVSHMTADTYGIGVLVEDLCKVYEALKAGAELPPAPGSFETVLKNDNAFMANEEAVSKDLAFFEEYFTKRHPDRPIYCGIHGNGSDRWLKYKRKGAISLPYLFIKCDTQGYRFTIPSAVSLQTQAWCAEHGVTMNSFFFYTCAIATSLLNDRARYQTPIELLNNRGTLAERKAAGTKAQSISVYTTVDYEKSFLDNLLPLADEQKELYRHTRLSYLGVEALMHKTYDYSMLGQTTPFAFSFIPMRTPKGMHLRVHSNGKGALVAYIAMMLDVDTNEIETVYDIQTEMVTPQQLVDFQNLWIHVVEAVMARSDVPMKELF